MGTQDSREAFLLKEIERLEKRLAAAQEGLGKLSGFIRPGAPVWYEARPGARFAATVDTEPRELGEGQWVVRLRDLDLGYYTDSGRTEGAKVPAAATWCLEPREPEAPDLAEPPPFDIVEAAWGLIANAGGGDWSRESEQWQQAAASWRDRYHRLLKSENQPQGPVRSALARIVSAIPECGPVPSVIDDDFVDDVINKLALALIGDRSLRRGREAELLRTGIEKIMKEAEVDAIGSTTVPVSALQRLIDNTDAADSLAFLEQNDVDASRYRRLQVLGCAPGGSMHLENRAVLRFSNLDEFVDADLKAHPSRGEGQKPVLSYSEAQRERDDLRAMLRLVLRSAVPNKKEHPTMYAAWRKAEALLGAPTSLREAVLADADPGVTVVSGTAGKVEHVDTIPEVHAAHHVLQARRATELLGELAGLKAAEDPLALLSMTLVMRIRHLLEDVAGLPDKTDARRPIAPDEDLAKLWYTHYPASAGELATFVHHLVTAYDHTIFTVPFAMAGAALAAARTIAKAVEPKLGKISGGAAGIVPLHFVRHFGGNDSPIGIRHYVDMLYPQYLSNFRTIPLEIFRWLQDEARQRLHEAEKNDDAAMTGPVSDEVRAHWRRIVDGEVPFGYQVKE